jgi:ATP-dependent RNA helicase SUPV3L1/SUV3
MSEQSRTVAVLGPTNTGKTHYAIERMLGYRTGIIGLPLRLLAREVYDRIVAVRGPSVVALVTGEERIVPPRAQYWVCTVEAMPEGMGTDFVAIDEIQLCADPERGHVFTDRLLRMRGTRETQFLGSHSMRPTIAALVPGVEFLGRARMSQLSYTGARKISRMPARSAIVGFSVENVYAIAELIRRQKGGAAVVMGALSPRTRNAQVALYQNGDVDYLVATDAIGMGLNLDIDHVAFSSLTKFDGRRMRPLFPHELGQIAGRAGRGMRDGTFGVTGEAPDLEPDLAEAIMDHRFAPVRKLEWRNARLAFGSAQALIASLEARPEHELLTRGREADDLAALKTLAEVPDVRARASDAPGVRLLWDVCRIPDFRGISAAEHASLLERIFCDLHEWGRVPDDWLGQQISRIDRVDGDIDTLSKRLAHIRTWTYVAQRKGWVDDETHWREATRAVEDRLSDALHGALTQRFVDRRTSVLMRRLKQKEAMVAEVNDQGAVSVEGEFIGRLTGFRFVRDKAAAGQEARTLEQASLAALAPHFHLKADSCGARTRSASWWPAPIR